MAISRLRDLEQNGAMPVVQLEPLDGQCSFGTINYGLPVTLQVHLKNTGGIIARISCSVMGRAAGWLSASPSSHLLLPSETLTVNITVCVQGHEACALSRALWDAGTSARPACDGIGIQARRRGCE